MPRLRKILFILFALLYIILCPLVIMYALGIIINPGTGNPMLKTGIISISSLPSGAYIYINGELYEQKTPAVINNLPPGNYTVKLVLKDYKAWQRVIPVVEEKATSIRNILLLPAQWKRSIISTNILEELRAFPGNTFLLLKRGPQLKDLAIYLWDEGIKTLISGESPANKANNLRPLFTDDVQFPNAKLINLYSVENSPFLLFQIDVEGEKKFLWIDPSSTTKVENITELLPPLPEEIAWDSQDNKNIFTIQDSSLSRINLGLKVSYPNIINNLQSAAIYNQNVYALTKDWMFERYDRDGTIQQAPVDDPQLTQALFKDKKTVKIDVVSDDLILFLTERGELICNRLPYRLVEAGVHGYRFDRKNQQLLFWTDRTLGWIDFTRKGNTNTTFERGPSLSWITQNGDFIRDAFWVNDGADVLYVDRDIVMLTDKGIFGSQPAVPVVTVKKNSHINYSDKSGELLFLKDPEGYLTSVEILPIRSLLRNNNERDRNRLKIK